MTGALQAQSWSAVLAGWPSMFLSVADIRDLAETRILSAEGPLLVALSDLSCLEANAHRGDVEAILTRLARLEDRPAVFARREWQVFYLEWELHEVEKAEHTDEPGLKSYFQMQALECAWEAIGRPLDVPPLNPLLRSYGHLDDPTGGLALTIHDLHAWLDEQRGLLRVVSGLLAAGQVTEVAVLARAFETAQANAEAHLRRVRSELEIQQVLRSPEQDTGFWQRVAEYNKSVMAARRERGAQILRK